jgi:hypothetical protein
VLTGRSPRRARTFPELSREIEQPPVPPREHNPAITAPLEAICLGCLAYRPEERFTAGELAEALRRFVAGTDAPPSANSPAPPRLEDFLGAVGGPEPQALRELLRLELHHRRAAGERPDPEEYRRRIPADGAALDSSLGPAAPPAESSGALTTPDERADGGGAALPLPGPAPGWRACRRGPGATCWRRR